MAARPSLTGSPGPNADHWRLGGLRTQEGRMSRGSLLVRDAVPEDAEALQAIWDDFNAEADAERAARVDHSLAETERAVMRLETDPSERLLVAVIDGEPVGVAHLRRAPISPIHEEDAVHVG